jgi:hypothetical protein
VNREFKISGKKFGGLISLVGQDVEVSLSNGNNLLGKLLSVDNGMVSIQSCNEPDRIIVFDLRNLISFVFPSKGYV